MCNVGANRNQAFVEFVDLNQAISMVSYYASSSEHAQVFSAFGFVHKIATFEKAAGFQALIQFTDAETASIARNALDGRSIPRDYTNPYLPVNPSAIDSTLQLTVGTDGKKAEPESNVLLASIEDMQWAVTVDVLHTVFSTFGAVQKIAIFEKNGGMQALIQYPDMTTAAVAKEALEGHCIYDGGYCKLHLSYSRHTDLNVKAQSDKSRDYTLTETGNLSGPQTSGVPVSSASAVWPGVPAISPGGLIAQPVWEGKGQGIGPAGGYHPQLYLPYSGQTTYVPSSVSSQQMPPPGGQPGAPHAAAQPLYF